MSEPHVARPSASDSASAQTSGSNTVPFLATGDPPVAPEDGNNTGESRTKEARRAVRPDIPAQASISDLCMETNDVFTQEHKAEAWSSAAVMVESYSDAMIKRWKEEIDTYLVFAGLFSAVLTTFNVQSYPLLQPAAPDPSLSVLQQISAQLASFSISPPFVNSTQPSSSGSQNASSPPTVPRWTVWLNALWFSSLVLSLSSASLGIMAKQWLNEYQSGVSGTSRPAARVRQHRLNNLRAWRVEDIINTIPILLQLALAFFLAGLLILLWNYDHDVAAAASALVGVLAVFTLVTTLLPLFDSSCSYLTPHIRAVHALWQPKYGMFWVYTRTWRGFHATQGWIFTSWRRVSLVQWPSMEHITAAVMAEAKAACGRLRRMVERLRSIRVHPPPQSWSDHKQTWQGRERSAVEVRSRDLDVQYLVEAYNITLHPDALSTATACLMDFFEMEVVDYFRQLHTSAREHFGAAADRGSGPLGYGNEHQLLWLLIILCVYRSDVSLTDEEAAALTGAFEHGYWSSSMQAADARWALSTLTALIDRFPDTEGRLIEGIDRGRLQIERGYLIMYSIFHNTPVASSWVHGVVNGIYREIRLEELRYLTPASPGDAKAVRSGYPLSFRDFLDCADRALAPTVRLPIDDLQTVRTFVRDVLAQLTHTLQRVVAEDGVLTRVQGLEIWDVMYTLANHVSDGVLQCMPDDLRADVLRMTDVLAGPHDYANNVLGDNIPDLACTLKEKIMRIKGTPDPDRSTAHTAATSPPEVAQASSVADPVEVAAAAAPGDSCATPVPGDDLQRKHPALPADTSS
ncbi:hypothetical protein C2E23DRAFT_843336 [Lenzites betulinus]|nr:hypothetical protein C2E23DRAFT_843336 [Lenzites betulinus]